MLNITIQPERQTLTIGVEVLNALTSGAKAVRVLTNLVDSDSFAKFAENAKTAGAVAIRHDSDSATKLRANVLYRAKARKLNVAVAPMTAVIDGEDVTVGHSYRLTK